MINVQCRALHTLIEVLLIRHPSNTPDAEQRQRNTKGADETDTRQHSTQLLRLLKTTSYGQLPV